MKECIVSLNSKRTNFIFKFQKDNNHIKQLKMLVTFLLTYQQINIYLNLMQKAVQQTSHEMNDWLFSFSESGLSSTGEIEAIAEQCNLFRPPTIIFGLNYCKIKHRTKGFQLLFNAEEALKFINYEHRKNNYYAANQEPKSNGISYIPPKLQIKHAQKWKQLGVPTHIQLTEVEQISDSFFVSPFKGKIQNIFKIQRVNQSVIPIHKLGPQNQMRFYKQGSLYEDQLDDNGLIQYQYKLRTMADGNWFILTRCYVRVDDVVVMILDTRVYWEEGWNKIARQFMVKQAKWSQLKAKGFDTLGGWTTNPHQSHMVYEYLAEKFVQNEYIHFAENPV